MILVKPLKNATSKWLGFLILIILFTFLNYNGKTLVFSKGEDGPVTVTEAFLLKEFPEMERIGGTGESDIWNIVYNRFDSIIGYYSIVENNRWNYTGYAGRIPLFIKLSPEKTIREIRLLENRETRRFLLKLYNNNFFKSWNGMTLPEAADSAVDSISGVTLSSNTVIANLSEILEITEQRSPMSRINFKQLIIRIAQFVLLIYALISFFIRDMRKFRTVYLLIIILLFGFTAGDFISMAMMRGFFTGAVPFRGSPVLWLVFACSILIPIFTNKSFYCSYMCPFGAAQELAGKFTVTKNKLPRSMKKALTYSRPLLFGAIALLIIMDYKIDLSLTEPFAAFLYSVAAPFTIFLAVASLILSLFFSKPWCRWLCPTGQFLEYFRSDK